ncbi:MAG: helix-turn-helix transcriptional regulator [Actinomycetota bacterium]
MAESIPDRFRRLLLLVPYVLARQGVPVADVCDRFGISRAQLMADLNLLFVCGLPGYGPGDLIDAFVDGDGVWIRMAEYFRRPLRLTPPEGLLLYAGARALASTGVADDALGRAIDRLGEALGPNVLDAVSVGLEEAVGLETIREALLRGRRVHIVYQARSTEETTERTVDPWAVFLASGRWYLAGWCHRVEDERVFRVDRMKSVALLEEEALVPDDVDLSRFASLQVGGGDDVRQVVLDVAPEAGWVVEHYRIASKEELGAGWVRIRLNAGGTAWIERLLLSLGARARVVAPDDLAERVRALACRLAGRYAER